MQALLIVLDGAEATAPGRVLDTDRALALLANAARGGSMQATIRAIATRR